MPRSLLFSGFSVVLLGTVSLAWGDAPLVEPIPTEATVTPTVTTTVVPTATPAVTPKTTPRSTSAPITQKTRPTVETLTSGLLMANTRYQTPYYIKKGPLSGPTVVVVGGCHGDEPAGYMAARQLKNWQVRKGTLVLVPDAHIEAIRRKVRAYPRNMNRLFPGKPNGDPMERLAYEVWTLIKKSKPQLVLTLHESRDFYARDPARYGQTFTFDFDELRPLFGRIAHKVNPEVDNPAHHFLLKVDAFPTCPTYCTWKYLHVPATSIETSKTLPLPTRIRYQLEACRAFFDEFGFEAVPRS